MKKEFFYKLNTQKHALDDYTFNCLGYISVNEEELECPTEYTWHNLDTSPVFYFGYAKSQEKEISLRVDHCSAKVK